MGFANSSQKVLQARPPEGEMETLGEKMLECCVTARDSGMNVEGQADRDKTVAQPTPVRRSLAMQAALEVTAYEARVAQMEATNTQPACLEGEEPPPMRVEQEVGCDPDPQPPALWELPASDSEQGKE